MPEKEINIFDHLTRNAKIEGAMLVLNVLIENGLIRGQDMARKALYSDNPIILEALDRRYKQEVKI